jgi:hypothetical protein
MDATLKTVLEATGAIVYYAKRQKDSVVPAIVYQEVSRTIFGHMLGASNLRKTRYQVTCIAKSSSGASDLSDAVDTALAYNHLDFEVCVPYDTKLVRYDANTSEYYIVTEYSIWEQ